MVSRKRAWHTPALAVVAWLSLGGTGSAQYVCGLGSEPCTIGTTWEEQPEYFGGYTEVRLPALSCTGCDGDFTASIELMDRSDNCAANTAHACWVAAGYSADAAHPGGYYFVQEHPPGGQWRTTFPGPVDQPLTVARFMIVKDARTSPASFLTFIYTDSLSTLWSSTSRTATGTAMRAGEINLGAMLFGTHGASSGTAYARRNIWAVVPVGPEYVFWYWPQTTQGFEYWHWPLFGGWAVPPGLPPPAPEGGSFMMGCCTL